MFLKSKTVECAQCGNEIVDSIHDDITKLNGKPVCDDCLREHKAKIEESIILTTTNTVEGYNVRRYISVESVEVVIGTGAISEFTGGLADIFGGRSTAFEEKLRKAKQTALSKLKVEAYNAGGNAVIGIDMDYTEFTSNRIGVVANGTVVKIEEASG